jgi:outer membrane protein, heavy metal efflux system
LPISRELFSTLEHRMHRRNFITHARWRTTASATLALAFAFALSTAAAGALAQTTAKPEGLTLSQAFEAAWARQPELAALAARRDAARAQQQAAQS